MAAAGSTETYRSPSALQIYSAANCLVLSPLQRCILKVCIPCFCVTPQQSETCSYSCESSCLLNVLSEQAGPAGGTAAAANRDAAAANTSKQSSKQSKLLELAPGPIPSSWTVSAKRRPVGAGTVSEPKLLYHAPSGEMFKTFGKAKSFWLSKGQRARRSDAGQRVKAEPSVGSQLPQGWQVATSRRSSTSARPGEAYKVYMVSCFKGLHS